MNERAGTNKAFPNIRYRHKPVMLKEVLGFLALKPGQRVVDATLGGAGYTEEISTAIGEKGSLYAFDLDDLAILNAERIIAKKKINNIILLRAGFDEMKEKLVKILQGKKIDAICFDLGLSSAQLDDKKRGFSFRGDLALDMSFSSDKADKKKTWNIINKYSQEDLEYILKNYGEEANSRRIAKSICEERVKHPINKTIELVWVIKKALPAKIISGSKIHFATKSFQAFRIATNDELGRLTKALPQALELLATGGRLVLVSYHSLEDRIVKRFFKQESRDCLCPPKLPLCCCAHQASLKIITKKPLSATQNEIKKNKRARSAKLRVAEKI